MKKVFFFALLLTGFVATAANLPDAPTAVNEKVLKAFKETFSAAKNVVWHEYKDYFQANFKQDAVQVRVQYDEDGELLKTIRYYGEKELLPNIVAKLKKKYAGKEITGVTEVTSDDEVSFSINLKDDKNWYIVKSDSHGSLQQLEKFKRADN